MGVCVCVCVCVCVRACVRVCVNFWLHHWMLRVQRRSEVSFDVTAVAANALGSRRDPSHLGWIVTLPFASALPTPRLKPPVSNSSCL